MPGSVRLSCRMGPSCREGVQVPVPDQLRLGPRAVTFLAGPIIMQLRATFLLASLFVGLRLMAQTTGSPVRDGLYLEGAGHAVYWSLNYESTVYQAPRLATHFRAGFGIYGEQHIDLFVAVPITFSMSYGGASRGELGMGVVPCVLIDRTRSRPSNTGELLLPTVHAGYRYQETDGLWFMRAGLLVAHFREDAEVFEGSEIGATWAWNPYLGAGLLF